VAHKEARKLRQLAQDDRQPSELVVEDLEQPGSDHDPLNANFLSHGENLELCQLADFCWQRRELIPADLKGRVVVRSRSSCHECRTSILLRLVSRPSSGGRDVSWLLKTWKPRACGQIAPDRFDDRTQRYSSFIMHAISLGSKQSLFLERKSCFKQFSMRNNSGGTSVKPMPIS
jgi:hypothetical protein